MSEAGPNEALSPVKRALVQLKQMRARVEAAERARTEPIAIVGIGCRFPGGAAGPDRFWQLLANGTDAIGEVPPERWDLDAYFDPDPDTPGKMCTRFGGFVADLDRFDPAFFGITPREAAAMDPQQRVLLEVCWEALEHAGQAPDRLLGAPVGVFVGLGATDYLQLELRAVPAERIDPYLATGGCGSVAAGRIAYALGLQGPCVAIDTACSSSLVAVHLAVQSLRAGECRMALAGGVSAILLPEITINFSRAGMMAPDGRCKTFDASADGYVRSEGCGIVVLERLSDALAARDRILAVVRGSAVNQDGRSSGLTVPNGIAQERVIRDALAAAGLEPADVQYVEAHGTGTSLGDPIELRALGATLTRDRPADSPLLVGSVKTNIGHLEAASGIAGLIKVALSLERGEIPPHLHLRERNPLVDWNDLRIEVPTIRTPWPMTNAPRTAAVSSFGFSGTNAHVVLQQAPPRAPGAWPSGRTVHVLTLSARSSEALRQAAGALRDHLRVNPGAAFADVCHTRNAGRAHFAHRLALVAHGCAEAEAQLDRWLAGQPAPEVITANTEAKGRPRVAFLFTGHGAQYPGMAQGLYDSEPVFRAALDRSAAILAPLIDRPLLSLLHKDSAQLERTCYAQPALFAVEYALAALWRSWGIEPDAVLGHSLGEDVAACVAGVFSLEDGLKMVAARGRLMEEGAPGGEMYAVFAPLGDVAAAIAGEEPRVSVAAINGPESIVISGDRTSLERVLATLHARHVKTRQVSGRYACHSPLMDPVLGPLEEVARQLTCSEPTLTLVSDITGAPVAPGEVTTAQYWRRHVREPVRFHDGMQALARDGIRLFVEIGPGDDVAKIARRCLPDGTATIVSSLRSGKDDCEHILGSLATLYAHGVAVDWVRLDEPFGRAVVALPTYPFERERYWFEAGRPLPTAAADEHEAEARWTSVAAAVREQSQQAPFDLNLDTYPEKWNCLERLTTAYIVAAFRRMRVFAEPGEVQTSESLVARCGIQSTYGRLVQRWLDRLAGVGLLERADAHFVARRPLPDLEVDEAVREARTFFADYPALLEYVERSGAALVDVVTGGESPLELLFPAGSGDLAAGLYERSPIARYLNAIVRSVVQSAAAGHDMLRVIEVGAGTGGTTRALLPMLHARRTSYTFTDVGPLFLTRAQEAFAAFDFVRYAALDLERAPADQGFEAHAFDIVLGANVLHATRNLDDTLEHARQLLAPGGLLLLVETTEHPAWFDITTGLISGWQRFEDRWRGDHPLLSPDRWNDALVQHGFDRVAMAPAAGAPAAIVGQHVIVARAPVVGIRAGAAAGTAPRAAIVEAPRAGASPVVADETGRVSQLRQLAATDRHERLVTFVRDAVMQVLRLDESRRPDRDRRLMDLGLDSLMAVELRNVLGRGLQVKRRLPATLMFDHPTIDAIASYLDRTIFSVAPAAPPPAESRREAPAARAAALDLASMDDAAVEALLKQRLEHI